MFRETGQTLDALIKNLRELMNIDAEKHSAECLAKDEKNFYSWSEPAIESELLYHYNFKYGMLNGKYLLGLTDDVKKTLKSILPLNFDELEEKICELSIKSKEESQQRKQLCKKIVADFGKNIDFKMLPMFFIFDSQLVASLLWDPINKKMLNTFSDFKKDKRLKQLLECFYEHDILYFGGINVNTILSRDSLRFVLGKLDEKIHSIVDSGFDSLVSQITYVNFLMLDLSKSHFDGTTDVEKLVIEKIFNSNEADAMHKLDALKDIKNFFIDYDAKFNADIDQYSQMLWNQAQTDIAKVLPLWEKNIFEYDNIVINKYRYFYDKGEVQIAADFPTVPGVFKLPYQSQAGKFYQVYKQAIKYDAGIKYIASKLFMQESDNLYKIFCSRFTTKEVKKIFNTYIKRVNVIFKNNNWNDNELVACMRKLRQYLGSRRDKKDKLGIAYFSIEAIELFIDIVYQQEKDNSGDTSEISNKHRNDRQWKLLQILKFEKNNKGLNLTLLTIIYNILYEREFYGGFQLRNSMAHYFKTKDYDAAYESAYSLLVLLILLIDEYYRFYSMDTSLK